MVSIVLQACPDGARQRNRRPSLSPLRGFEMLWGMLSGGFASLHRRLLYDTPSGYSSFAVLYPLPPSGYSPLTGGEFYQSLKMKNTAPSIIEKPTM